MKTQVEINGKVFVMRIVEGISSSSTRPGYCCQCDFLYSKVEESSTCAIFSLYQSIFCTKTKYSRTSVIGLDNLQIIDELLVDVKFRPFSIEIEKLHIFIYNIESSKQEELLNAGII